MGKGYKIVIGIKKKSETSKVMHFIRGCYYKLMNKITSVEQIEHFTGFGLYDREFLNIINENNGPLPYIRGFVAKYGYKIKRLILYNLIAKVEFLQTSFFVV